jgi:hypothetical protein
LVDPQVEDRGKHYSKLAIQQLIVDKGKNNPTAIIPSSKTASFLTHFSKCGKHNIFNYVVPV